MSRKSVCVIAIAVAIVLLLVGTAAANTATFKGQTVTIHGDKSPGKWVSSFTINDIACKNNVVYVATDKIIKIVDISSARTPIGIQSLLPGGKQIEIKRDYMYIRTADGTLRLYDVKNKFKARFVKEYTFDSSLKIIEIHGTNLYTYHSDKTSHVYKINSGGILTLKK